jgi:hypothetical protein
MPTYSSGIFEGAQIHEVTIGPWVDRTPPELMLLDRA